MTPRGGNRGGDAIRRATRRGARLTRVAEAVSIARYLIGRDPAPEVVDRYLEACAVRLPGKEEEGDEVRWMRERPWSIPFLDAGAGVWSPGSIVRRRVLLMAAILEASPRHAGFFLHAPATRAGALGELAAQGIRAVWLLAAGVPLYAWVSRGATGAGTSRHG